MGQRELKVLLKESLVMEEELVELVEACLKELFPIAQNQALYLFKEGYDNFDVNGCLQGLYYIKRNICINGQYPYREDDTKLPEQTE